MSDRRNGKALNRIVLKIEGGIIFEVVSDQDVEVHILDYDTESAEPNELTKVEDQECYWSEAEVTVNSGRVNRWLQHAKLNTPKSRDGWVRDADGTV